MSGSDGDGGDGGGFGAEDAGAEGDVLPLVLGEEGHFFGGPAAFGAYGDGRILTYVPAFAETAKDGAFEAEACRGLRGE